MIKMKLSWLNLSFFIVLSIISGIVNSSPSIYEDAEDGNTAGWEIYDATPLGAAVSNIFDTQKNSKAIQFSSTALQNGFRLGHSNANHARAWHNITQKLISWDGNFSEPLIIYIAVQTKLGFRYLYYTDRNSDLGFWRANHNYIHHGLGASLTDGVWHRFNRDLEADLQDFEPANQILSVNGFLIRGTGRVDNIALSSQTQTTSISEVEAARFLTQATFGPTETAINELVSLNDFEAWIDNQISLPVSRTLPYVLSNSNGSLKSTRHSIWWQNVIQGKDQLRQRVAFALSEIFVISDLDYSLGNSQYGVSHYYDMLAENAFGNYRELLEKVTLHPAMGIYLGMVRNQKANAALNIRPDENYAREVLQLFSIGLHQLSEALPFNDPVATYSQDTVENFARVFTGWNFVDSPGLRWISRELSPKVKNYAALSFCILVFCFSGLR